MQQAAPPPDSVNISTDNSFNHSPDNSFDNDVKTISDVNANTDVNVINVYTVAEQNSPDTELFEQPFTSKITDNAATTIQKNTNLTAQYNEQPNSIQPSSTQHNEQPSSIKTSNIQTDDTQQNKPYDTPQQSHVAESHTPASTAAPPQVTKTTTPANTENPQIVANPLDLLTCPTAELVGEWTLEKWEYWLRNASLIPAVLNLAHKGVMTGEIGKTAHLQVPKAVEKVAHDEFFQRLKARLQEDWANMQVSYEILDASTSDQLTDMTTPEQQQIKRKQQAQQAAEEKMLQEPVVQALITEFHAVVEKIELQTTG